ncbi:potassium transporter Kup [Candidatus Contendibacter odensensis]|uniref:Probable potassium transport system protein Kup n=1 Tax=Candidatus Contendobacter odensis Run_B_J11 TaxID=1400861 RepID=A0A7U7G903_9GAMM|nr:potassium transporter Kup [Candidatus Contendobacter odensis]CDH43696.1 putative potassium transport system protein kup 1 [Candidatus Contendobacter odensis Run_B_J11]
MSANENKSRSSALIVGAIGVVFGDIGTSPLYALKETFAGHHPMTVEPASILGVLSLIFWTIMALVTLKYVAIIMRADNRGEGGSLALLARVTELTKNSRVTWFVTMLGIFAAALFYGDSMITPAISVLSAVEGLEVVAPQFKEYVLPITAVVLTALFWIQRHGTGVVGQFFGPVMCAWFGILAVLGAISVWEAPAVLSALNPLYALNFLIHDPWNSFLALGAIVLSVTGGEALYTDMGHFGKFPIRVAWFCFVLPALVLNYYGQGALLLKDPTAIQSPFYLLAPGWALVPMVVLATAATVIASQAVISGAFSVARQAVQLGYLPRMRIVHTSYMEAGQIYVPFTNWTLYLAVMALVFGFQSSSNLAAAYGIAVTGTMMIDTVLVSFVVFLAWRWNPWLAAPLLAGLLLVDIAFFSANAIKLLQGGWFPVAIALVSFTTLTTWRRGRHLLFQEMGNLTMPLDQFIRSIENTLLKRVSSTAVYLTSRPEGAPSALLHNIKHNEVLHARNVLVTVLTAEIPYVADANRIEIVDLDKSFYRVFIRYGFMEQPDIPKALEACAEKGLAFDLDKTSFFLSREVVVPKLAPPMMLWRELLFIWMLRNAQSATDFFRIPTNRVVELGTLVEI